jgi:hypothetical protein
MKKFALTALFLICWIPASAPGAEPPLSDDTQECMECHVTVTPGIVQDWRMSRHASQTPALALEPEPIARRVSSPTFPDAIKDVAVGCAECHALRSDSHEDTFEHNGVDIHVVVSPKDCATCHQKEEEQYGRNLMAHAYGNLMNNGVYQMLQKSINDDPIIRHNQLTYASANDLTSADSCLYCHGTKLSVIGSEVRETDYGDMNFPVIAGWPNQGVGRINLDGSLGSCTACHGRHRFSIEMARKPYTCKECHAGPDVPAFKVFTASKHGNLFSSHQKEWNFNSIPWVVGKDFSAPTCAACHLSLVADDEGNVIVDRSHEMKDRLPWRIFGLIYAHPHPRDGDTTIIRNKDGLPLPTDFAGGFAEPFLVNAADQKKSREKMQALCLSCHDKSWVSGHWDQFMNTLEETNRTTLTATQLMAEIWKEGYAVSHAKGGNPFDEYIEKVWSDIWLFYGNSVRFSSAMGGGGDYGVFADGRYHMKKGVAQLHDWLQLRKTEK